MSTLSGDFFLYLLPHYTPIQPALNNLFKKVSKKFSGLEIDNLVRLLIQSGWHSSMVMSSGPLKKAIFMSGISVGDMKKA